MKIVRFIVRIPLAIIITAVAPIAALASWAITDQEEGMLGWWEFVVSAWRGEI